MRVIAEYIAGFLLFITVLSFLLTFADSTQDWANALGLEEGSLERQLFANVLPILVDAFVAASLFMVGLSGLWLLRRRFIR